MTKGVSASLKLSGAENGLYDLLRALQLMCLAPTQQQHKLKAVWLATVFASHRAHASLVQMSELGFQFSTFLLAPFCYWATLEREIDKSALVKMARAHLVLLIALLPLSSSQPCQGMLHNQMLPSFCLMSLPFFSTFRLQSQNYIGKWPNNFRRD